MTPRIVHVASGREWRGGQRQVLLLAQSLARLGVEQVVVTGTRTELARRLRFSGIPIRTTRWTVGLDPRVIPVIIHELRRKPALLHAHDAHSLSLAGLCATLTGTPLVVTRRVDFPLRRRGFWTRAQRVIAISNAVASVLVQGGVAAERISVIHSGISLDGTRMAGRMGVRDRLGLAANTRVAANVAALVGHKDHGTLVNAAKELERRQPDLHWVVAGEGDLRPALEAQIERLGVRGRVHLMGQIVNPEGLIADADVFVMSSRQEGLGTSVLEAMALGIPVASTRAGGLPEMLDDGAGLLVEPGDSAGLARAVERILLEPDTRTRLVEQARSRVLRFTDSRMAEEVRSVYRSCAHSLDGS